MTKIFFAVTNWGFFFGMFLFIGLGNHGLKYQKNRHNAGFLMLDALFRNLELPINETVKFSSLVSDFNSRKHGKIVCAKPQTYMNLSGRAVLQLMQFYKVKIGDVFIFHDDIDLEFGKLKIKIGGGNGGHNGLRSIDEMIGREYVRVRIGVGRPAESQKTVADFVLSDFSPLEISALEKIFEKISKNIDFLLEKQFSQVLQEVNLVN